MPGFSLKRYQAQALLVLDNYLQAALLSGPRAAFEQITGFGYNTEPFGELPCVCLRIPTGGGKTLLGAHAVGRMASGWPARSAQPLALWLVPSDTIRSQTLNALAPPGHPLHEALAQACGDGVRVCGLDELAAIAPQDFDQQAVVVVATIQSFRVEDTEQRNVYAFSEAWERHFRSLGRRRRRRCRACRMRWSPPPRPRPTRRGGRCWPAWWASRAGAWPTGWRCASPI